MVIHQIRNKFLDLLTVINWPKSCWFIRETDWYLWRKRIINWITQGTNMERLTLSGECLLLQPPEKSAVFRFLFSSLIRYALWWCDRHATLVPSGPNQWCATSRQFPILVDAKSLEMLVSVTSTFPGTTAESLRGIVLVSRGLVHLNAFRKAACDAARDRKLSRGYN